MQPASLVDRRPLLLHTMLGLEPSRWGWIDAFARGRMRVRYGTTL